MQKLKTITGSLFSLQRRGLLRLGLIVLIIITVFLIFKFLYAKYKPATTEVCIVTGCNGEICQGKDEEPIMSICLWKEEYQCYKTAKCEVQKDSRCGWTQSEDLKNCLFQY